MIKFMVRDLYSSNIRVIFVICFLVCYKGYIFWVFIGVLVVGVGEIECVIEFVVNGVFLMNYRE